MIKLPDYELAKCCNCDTLELVAWGIYGSETTCQNCDAPPAAMEKVN